MQGRSGRMNKYITYENALDTIGIRHKSWYNLLKRDQMANGTKYIVTNMGGKDAGRR